jgi:hypothetical protein
MIKFEKHDGMLFRMLEEPVPCESQLKWNYIAGIAHDKPLLIRTVPKMINPRVSIKTLNDLSKVKYVVHYGLPAEIIGTFVEEGSADWALYRLMQGDIVMGQYRGDDVMVTSTSSGWHEVIRVVLYGKRRGMPITDDDFLFHAEKDGWQLYEPEPEPKYKVGDWVEWSEGLGISYQSQITRVSQSAVYSKGICIPLKIITRKLKPSQVVVKIGCLSGTVERHDGNPIYWFKLRSSEYNYALISIEMLDTTTRELVESLLKAMRGES